MSSTILVTGATGFLGGHVVQQLLDQGYTVRAIVRPGKGDSLQGAYSKYGNKLEVVTVDDLISGDLSNVLKGVYAVIHTAAPLSGRTSPADALNIAIEGSINILRQAYAAGVRKFVFVSSVVAINPIDPESDFKETTWPKVSKEEALSGTKNAFYVYVTQKVLSEQAVWDFAKQHPDLDVTVINPPFFFGPFAPSYSNPDAIKTSLSTNTMIYALIQPDGGLPIHPSWIDVRDVAQSLVKALKSPPESQVGRKRIILSGEWFSFKDAADYLVKVRPELKDRISEKAKAAPPVPESQIDTTRAREVLGVVFTPWKKTVIDTIDGFIDLEKEWKKNGATLH
ncbi:NAD-P-binding protein [Abortiporus biennis]|nr:NAD-P-binding protein [Abortiporus biennis]